MNDTLDYITELEQEKSQLKKRSHTKIILSIIAVLLCVLLLSCSMCYMLQYINTLLWWQTGCVASIAITSVLCLAFSLISLCDAINARRYL